MIRAWREYFGMTQPALARLGKSKSKPWIGTLKKIAAAMESPVSSLPIEKEKKREKKM